MISRRCHSALYGCLVHNFLPEVSHGSLARVHVLGRHSECRALGALRARGSPRSNSIVCYLDSPLMVQGPRRLTFCALLLLRSHCVPRLSSNDFSCITLPIDER